MTRPTFTVTAAGLLNVDGTERNGLLLEGPQDAIKAGAALAFQDVAVVPFEEMQRLTAEVERMRGALLAWSVWANKAHPPGSKVCGNINDPIEKTRAALGDGT